MELSEMVAELESEKAELESLNANMRAGWQNDLEVLMAMARRQGFMKTAEAVKGCLDSLEVCHPRRLPKAS